MKNNSDTQSVSETPQFYAMTLEHWAERFENKVDRVQEMFDERFVRMWRLYLKSCATSFRYSGLNIHQLVFSKGLNNALPLTRTFTNGDQW